jgi:hypothetical protein
MITSLTPTEVKGHQRSKCQREVVFHSMSYATFVSISFFPFFSALKKKFHVVQKLVKFFEILKKKFIEAKKS